MFTSKVSAKGRIVIPAAMRNKFGIKKGSQVAIVEEQGKLMIKPMDSGYFEEMAGILGTDGSMLKSLREDKKKEHEL